MTAHAPSGPILEVFPVLFWSWMTNLYGCFRSGRGMEFAEFFVDFEFVTGGGGSS